MKRIAVVTFARSDYAACLSIARLIAADPDLDLYLVVSGMHLSPEFGYTVREIEADRLEISERVEMLLSSDSAEGLAKSLGLGTLGLAQCFARSRPDVLLLCGDRLELLCVASAVLPFGIPMAHVSGGEVTEGAIDNQVRYAVTKMSHLHFVAMAPYAERLIRSGEERWRVHVTGDPALDVLHETPIMSREELSRCLGVELAPPVIVMTLHPTTLSLTSQTEELPVVLSALSRIDATLIITYPNADPHGRAIVEGIGTFVRTRPRARVFPSLGQKTYYSLLSYADAMVGNSSSGIWEAPSFRLPSVNVGERQKGRIRPRNVIDVGVEADAIGQALRRALAPSFRASLIGLENPYGDGKSAARIVEILKEVELGPRLLQKRVVDDGGETASTLP